MPAEGSPSGSRFGRMIVRLRFVIVIGWLVAAYVATTQLPTIQEAQTGALGDLVPTDARALDAELRASRLFDFPLLSRTVVVQRDPGGLSAAEQARVIERAVELNRGALPGFERVGGALAVTNALGAPPFSRERSTTALTFLFFEPDVHPRVRQSLAERFVQTYAPEGAAFVGVTGALAARHQQGDIITERLPLVQAATLLLVVLVTGLYFRSVAAPLIVVLAVGVAYLVAVRVVAGLGARLDVSVPSEVEPVMVVLLFGVITDYAIFYIARARSALAEGFRPAAATTQAVSELMPMIGTAGLTVAGATAALIVAELGFFRAFGPGTALAVLIGLSVALTLIPACLAIGGRALFWPGRRPRDGAQESTQAGPERSRVVELAIRQPVVTAATVCIVLLLCAAGLDRIQVGNAIIRGLPEEAPAHRAYTEAGRGFAPGVLAPTVVLLEGEGITRRRAELAELQAHISALPGVAQVVGPRQQPADVDLGAVYSRTGDAARLLVVLDMDPLGARAITLVGELRERLPGMLADSGLAGARVRLAGDTALSAETVGEAGEDLFRIAVAALAVVIGILAVFLRALVAPVYLIAASVLALTASLGIATYVFQELVGYAGLTYYVPFAAAVLLVALGSDYNVYLTGRIWLEARRRPLRAAVSVASARATRAITVAALVLALSFAMLALVPIRAFRELAFVMSIGLLVDAFFVRTLLMPALITLFGRFSRWPGSFPTPSAVPALPPSGPDGAAAASADGHPGRDGGPVTPAGGPPAGAGPETPAGRL